MFLLLVLSLLSTREARVREDQQQKTAGLYFYAQKYPSPAVMVETGQRIFSLLFVLELAFLRC